MLCYNRIFKSKMAANISYFIVFAIIAVVNGKPAAEDAEAYVAGESGLQKILQLLANQGKYYIALSHHEDGPKKHHEDTARIISAGRYRDVDSDEPVDLHRRPDNHLQVPKNFNKVDKLQYKPNRFQPLPNIVKPLTLTKNDNLEYVSNGEDNIKRSNVEEALVFDLTRADNEDSVESQVKDLLSDNNDGQDSGVDDYVSGIEKQINNGGKDTKGNYMLPHHDHDHAADVIELLKNYLPRTPQQEARREARLKQEEEERKRKEKEQQLLLQQQQQQQQPENSRYTYD
ncbi:SUN domain-containing protein 2-like isoform X4 [Spodoptera frugiperda]|uniref:SUN domain-containing protein 2-like isoform X4 n=1 Tax=Spodoptera frugiperda TaxID=7108 RepID=A0A9R0DSC2_SPOFR|nr:SUN domain-containing protein 2-like isoform X4 [Spodoptera frugiperda]